MQTPGQNTILPLPVPEKASENGKGPKEGDAAGLSIRLERKEYAKGKGSPLHTLILIWDISTVHKTL